MAASEFDRIDVDLEYDGFEVAADRSQSDAWSLGCDISIEDIDATIQEISVKDIALSGSIVKQEISVNIDSDKTNVMDLDVNIVVNGVSSSLVESQIVPYENILKITSFSPEAVRETRYASSAYAAKLIYDLISAINLRVGKLESTNEQGGVINGEIEKRLKYLEDNQFFERYDDSTVKTKYNLFSDYEISAHGLNIGSGGSGEGGSGVSYLKDLWDVTIVSAANDDILVYNGTHWVNMPQSFIMPDLSVLENYLLKTDAAELYLLKDAANSFATKDSVQNVSNALVELSEEHGNRLNVLEKLLDWFHLTEDGESVYTEKNFFSTKEISAKGLNAGSEGGSGLISIENIIGVSLSNPVTGDVFVYNGTHWTNIPQSNLIPDLSGYATTDSVTTVSNKVVGIDERVKSVEDKIKSLETEKFFFKKEGIDDVIFTSYNLVSEKEISAHGLNYGSGEGASGMLKDLLDVKADSSSIGDLLVYDGTHWINTPQSAILPSIDTSVIATREWVNSNYASTSALSSGINEAKGYTDILRTYVKEQDQILSNSITEILDWFTLKDGVLLTKYNLASEKEVSAKGINASQGGGSAYNRLDSWSAYDSSKAGYVLSALLGYDLHSRVTTLENAEVDLSDYYTKSQTNSQIASAIGAIDLSPYATKEALSTLEGQHDTLRSEFDALNNLLSSDTTDYINTWNEVVAFLDGYKDESDLATILSGMNRDIASRLLTSDFESWKTNTFTPHANLVANHTTRLDGLDQSILSINTRIDGVNKTIEDHIAEFTAFRANFEISDDLILVRKNFASTKEVSAKGISQGSGGEGGGSSYPRLDTWDGYDSNKAGYVLSAGLGYGLKVAIDELEGYNLDSRVSAIENAGYTTKTYVDESFLNKNSGGFVYGLLTAVAGMRLTNTETNIGTLYFGATDGQTIANTDSSLLQITSPSIVLKGFTSVDGKLQATDTITALNDMSVTKGLSVGGWGTFRSGLSVEGGNLVTKYDISVNSGHQIFWTDANSVKHGITYDESAGAFKLDGKFITTGSGASLTWGEISGKPSVLDFGGTSSQFLKADGSLDGTSYLPTSGGVIRSDKLTPLEIFTTNTTEVGISLVMTNAYKGWVGYNSTYGTILFNYASGAYLGIRDNGVAALNHNELLHTGNYSSYALPLSGGTVTGDLTLSSSSLHINNGNILFNETYHLNNSGDSLRWYAGGWNTLLHSGNIVESVDDLNDTTMWRFFKATYKAANLPTDTSNYLSGISFATDGATGYRHQLGGDYSGRLFYRHMETEVWRDWKTIAFTDSNITGNAATATYASNAGTLAGISLSNGSNTPWGTIPMITEGGYMDVGRHFEFHYDNTTGSDFSTVLMCTGNYGNFVYLPSANGTLALTTDNVASATKLATPRTIWGQIFDGTDIVDGDLHMHTSAIYFNSDKTNYNMSCNGTTVMTYDMYGGHRFCTYGAGQRMLINQLGNVTIGATELASSSYRLYVDGTARFAAISDTSSINHYDSGKGYFVGLRNSGLGVTTGGLLLYTYGATPMSFYTDGSERMRITASGNIGIGTADPQYKLHVEGTGYFSGAVTAIGGLTVNGILTVGGASIHPTANNPYFQLYQNNNYWYWQADNSYTYIGGTMNKALRIDQDGNTLIRGSLGVDALLTASNGLTVSKGISATDGIVADWITAGTITANTSATIAALTVNGNATIGGDLNATYLISLGASLEYVELSHATPYIDFHYGKDANDYTLRLIESTKGQLDIVGAASIQTKLYVGGDATLHSGLLVGGASTLASLTVTNGATVGSLTSNGTLGVSGLSTLTGGIATNDIHGNGQSLYLGNASNNAYIKVREDMQGSSSMWSIPRDGRATFTSLTTPTLSVTGSATIASVTIEAGTATLRNLTVNTLATLKQLVVGTDGMSCNGPATFNDFIYSSSITPKNDNYYVLGNNNYKWYAVTTYNVNVHEAITIEAGKELRFKDDDGVVHTLKYDSTKQAFVFDGNVNATGEMSAKKLNA